MRSALQLIPLNDFPLVQPGQNIAEIMIACLACNQLQLATGDVLIVAQKIISKVENRYVRLRDVVPGDRAIELAEQANKDPRLVELILRESKDVVRVKPGVIIVEHRNGYIHANAGIDKSNIPNSKADPWVLLLPENPDLSAQKLADALQARTGIPIAVIINDSVGRPWRNGTVGIALGTSGFNPLYNQIGEHDLFGNTLEVTEAAVADELAAAASLVMGQAAEACPVVLARGLTLQPSSSGSGTLLRLKAQDLFR